MAYNFPDAPFNGQAFAPPGGPIWEFGGGVWRQAAELVQPVAGASVLDVHMFGAVGDGVTDDQPAIQAALDAAEGRALFFPRGDYYVSYASRVREGTTVFGEGYGSRILMPVDGWTISITDFHGAFVIKGTASVPVTGVRITNMRFRGLGPGVPVSRAPKPIYCEYTRGLKIDHCWFEDHAWEVIWGGGAFDGNREVLVANNHFRHCGYPNEYGGLPCIQPNGIDGLVIGNVLLDVGCGIGPVGYNMVTVGNLIDGIQNVGIGVGDGVDHNDHIITGNSIRFSGTAAGGMVQGISIGGGAPPYGGPGQVNVTGNTVRMDGSVYNNCVGIAMTTAKHANISNNTVEVIGRGAGILAYGIPSGNTVLIRSNTVQGIDENGSIYGIVCTPQAVPSTLTVHSMNNYVYGLTAGMSSYAYDFRDTVGSTLVATSTNDMMDGGRYRMGDIEYGAGELNGIPINARRDRTKTDSFDQIAGIGMLNFGPGRYNAISGGVLALGRTDAGFMHKQTRVLAMTEGSAGTDDLDTISGTSAGDFLILSPATDGTTVVAKDNTGNLRLAGDFTMDNLTDTLMLISDGTYLYELSRSDNGT